MMLLFLFFFFFNDTATTEIYTLPLHDALPIFSARAARAWVRLSPRASCARHGREPAAHLSPGGVRRRRPVRRAATLRGGLRHRSEEHTSELQSQSNLVCRLLLEKKKQ